MKEILNLLELYKNEINRLENELIEKSNIANKYQALKEEELDALKFRYNDLIDCYNKLEESSVGRFRELRRKIITLCPEKALQVERTFDQVVEAEMRLGDPMMEPPPLEERAEEEEEDQGDRSGERLPEPRPAEGAATTSHPASERPAVVQAATEESLQDISSQIERLKLQLYYYE